MTITSFPQYKRLNKGFTLVELLIVITIILVLAGLLVPIITLVANRQRVAEARVEMQGLSLALSVYLRDYGILGEEAAESPTDFKDQPGLFLIQRPFLAGKDPYVEPKPNRMVNDAGQVVAMDEATQILNIWGVPIEVIVTNAKSSPSQPYDFTKEIEIRSGDGTGESDQVLIFNLDHDSWRWEEE